MLYKKTNDIIYAKGGCYPGICGNNEYDGQTVNSVMHGCNNLQENIIDFDTYTISAIVYENGDLYTCGYNYRGLVGDNTRIDRHVLYNALTDVKEVSVSEYFILALKEDGSVWAWGDNSWGQLGDGRILESLTPMRLGGSVNSPIEPSVTSATITAGNGHSSLIIDGVRWHLSPLGAAHTASSATARGSAAKSLCA